MPWSQRPPPPPRIPSKAPRCRQPDSNPFKIRAPTFLFEQLIRSELKLPTCQLGNFRGKTNLQEDADSNGSIQASRTLLGRKHKSEVMGTGEC